MDQAPGLQPDRPSPVEATQAVADPFTALESPWTARIERHRFWVFAMVVLLHALAFNGQWRVGADSARYRQLGHNLAQGRGYVYHGEPETMAHPGLPWLLGALEWAFGPKPFAPLLLMSLFAGVSLWAVYQWVCCLWPRWLAVVVAAGTGISAQFLLGGMSLLTDMPFLTGVCLSLCGYEWIRSDRAAVSRRGWCVLAVGVLLCVLMRPTAWLLVLALAVGGWWQMRPRRWTQGAWVLALLCLLCALWWWIDPRQGAPLLGDYIRRGEVLVLRITQPSYLWSATWQVLEDTLPRGVFGFELGPGANSLAVLVLLAAVAALMRVRPWWGMLALGLCLLTWLTGSVPRFYLMVQPIFVLAWCWLWARAAQRWPHRRTVCVTLGIMLFCVPNLACSIKLAAEQRRASMMESTTAHRWDAWVGMGRTIGAVVPAERRVLAPEGAVLTYTSDRQVGASSRLVRRLIAAPREQWPDIMQQAGFHYAVLPSSLYAYPQGRPFQEMLDRGLLVPLPGGIQVDGMWLARVELRPAADWHKRPRKQREEMPGPAFSGWVQRNRSP